MNLGKIFWSKEQRAGHNIIEKIMALCPGIKEIYEDTGAVNIEIKVINCGTGGADVEISARERE